VKPSLLLPPSLAGKKAGELLKQTLEPNPPIGATVTLVLEKASTGWNAPATQPWLAQALDDASRAVYGKAAAAMGEGGTIPFMAMLGERFPQAQFLITGVLGPKSNAHGPNEFLHIDYAKRLTACVAHVLAEHASAHR
jgi:acetylornithine deacetylase/succinyl-diaminopimelate desuccinylase-like protein